MMLSTTNWMRISLLVAPKALRVPISRVRSVTDTSMMFITPMPPTSSEMPAITEMAMDRVFMMVDMDSTMVLVAMANTE